MAALRMVLNPLMQQVVEIALSILPTSITTPDQVLDQIGDYVRAKRNITLDRVTFEKRRQVTSESFDYFFIGHQRLAHAADLLGICSDSRMATRIMAGIRDSVTKKKLLVLHSRHCIKRLMYVVAKNLPVQISALFVTKRA
jgi:hypothetical protein